MITVSWFSLGKTESSNNSFVCTDLRVAADFLYICHDSRPPRCNENWNFYFYFAVDVIFL